MAHYESIDKIQNALASEVFKNAIDKKKAAGRALGTLIEIITYYWLYTNSFKNNLTIEHAMVEFGNVDITHNVEFGLHPVLTAYERFALKKSKIGSITSSSMLKKIIEVGGIGERLKKSSSNIYKSGMIKNSSLVRFLDDPKKYILSNIEEINNDEVIVTSCVLSSQPFAIVECKRVGVEEGTKKGPTTIEKAKQGAYVAKHVSKLQKVKDADGSLWGVLPLGGGKFDIKPYREQLRYFVNHIDSEEMDGIVLTIGVTSNHGNWFTKGNMNKELLVLNQSYDWLLFLRDQALAKFVSDLILDNDTEVKRAFLATYGVVRATRGINKLTKSTLTYEAHLELIKYFQDNWATINADRDGWFDVLGPKDGELSELIEELNVLKDKKWK